MTRHGAESAEFLVGLKRGVVLDADGNVERELTAKEFRYRVQANYMILERLYGKAPLTIESHEETETKQQAWLILQKLPTSVLEQIRLATEETMAELPAPATEEDQEREP